MSYRERLFAPVWWWAFGLLMVVSAFVAVWAYLGVEWATGVGLLFGVAVAALLIGWGSPIVQVNDAGVSVGRAHIGWKYVGDIEALDAEHTKRVLGVEADARNWFFTRPYISTAFQLTVADDADPHPAWVVSARRPAAVVAAARSWMEQHAD